MNPDPWLPRLPWPVRAALLLPVRLFVLALELLLAWRAVRLMAPPRDRAATGRWTWIAATGWAGQQLRVAVDPETLLVRRLEVDGLRGRRRRAALPRGWAERSSPAPASHYLPTGVALPGSSRA